jgi:hypothetical protein
MNQSISRLVMLPILLSLLLVGTLKNENFGASTPLLSSSNPSIISVFLSTDKHPPFFGAMTGIPAGKQKGSRMQPLHPAPFQPPGGYYFQKTMLPPAPVGWARSILFP